MSRVKPSFLLGLLGSLLIAAACSNGEDDPRPPAERSDATVGIEEPSPPALPSGAEPDPLTGPAAEDSPLPAVTREDLLQEWWQSSGLQGDPVPVDLVREVSNEEYEAAQIACMTEAGWPPTGQGLSFGAPPEQAETLGLALYTCMAQYPTRLAYLQPYDRAQLDLIYDWVLEETVPCYAEQGYDVTDVPTRDAFAGDYFATRTFWTPTRGLGNLGPQASIQLEETCPRMPPPPAAVRPVKGSDRLRRIVKRQD